jgi:glycerol uptake facilitator-like aquaporin
MVRRTFSTGELSPYIGAQVVGGIAGATVLFIIASGQAGFDASAGFASNGYGAHSPGGYTLMAALVIEVVMTFMFLVIILGAIDKRAPQRFAPIAIGLGEHVARHFVPAQIKAFRYGKLELAKKWIMDGSDAQGAHNP